MVTVSALPPTHDCRPVVQIRIEGTVERIPFQASCDYFHSRPKSSQIGAVVSRQSTPVPSRGVRAPTHTHICTYSSCKRCRTFLFSSFFQYLRQKNAELQERFKDSEVPMPDYW